MIHRVLLVEDDEKPGRQIVDLLRRAGLATEWLRDGREAVDAALQRFDLVILDLMLPGAHGLDVLRQLRPGSDVPVLVLTGRNETADKVRALELGADDYLIKPFWGEELLARVRARIRRPALQRSDDLTVGDIGIDTTARRVRVNGEPVELTRVELEILVALARRPGAAVSRGALVEEGARSGPRRDGAHPRRARLAAPEEARVVRGLRRDGVGDRLPPGGAGHAVTLRRRLALTLLLAAAPPLVLGTALRSVRVLRPGGPVAALVAGVPGGPPPFGPPIRAPFGGRPSGRRSPCSRPPCARGSCSGSSSPRGRS